MDNACNHQQGLTSWECLKNGSESAERNSKDLKTAKDSLLRLCRSRLYFYKPSAGHS